VTADIFEPRPIPRGAWITTGLLWFVLEARARARHRRCRQNIAAMEFEIETGAPFATERVWR